MPKPVNAVCEQQRQRSACEYVQSDHCHCYSLPRQYYKFLYTISQVEELSL